ncbi:TetR family transcriptional regulator [Pseudolysinimonas kribbensis]|uniref:TetR family transcriptional regulator n=1 Tax=Pseudolysinimonas kribbensis TaxID=433641 RepID=A0ABQ6K2L1_9MICO|nr:TetR family transcriptional regulator [Pseudolysinimonas kribbensis]GMA94858.1 TetR family transcriptional regulator [Pseudolysinimonas kribbensis]
MAYNSAETRRRLLEAAIEEFSAHGIAGARVETIARRARANKQAIYQYFGSKERLFLAAFEDRMLALQQTIHFDESDLAEYAGRVFDAYADSPQTWRITFWAQLERGLNHLHIPALDAASQEHAARILQAQQVGRITRRYTPETILALSRSLALTWQVHPAERDAITAQERGKRREVVVASMRALLDDDAHD